MAVLAELHTPIVGQRRDDDCHVRGSVHPGGAPLHGSTLATKALELHYPPERSSIRRCGFLNELHLQARKSTRRLCRSCLQHSRPLQSPSMAEATQSILLLHVTGEDRPGITAALTRILGEQRIEILDINQTVIHKTLLLGMMVRIPPAVESTSVLKDLLFAAHRAELQLRITPVDDEQYDAWVARQGKPRFILT